MWKCTQLVCHDLLDVVHSSKLTTFGLEVVFKEKEKSHTDSDQVSMWAAEPLEYPLLLKLRSRRWQCDKERSRDAASNCPHAHFLGQNVMDCLVIQIQLTADHSDCQTSIRPHNSPHFDHIFLRFLRARPSRTMFVFHTLTAIQNDLWNLTPVPSIQHALHQPNLIFCKFLLRFH
jgi:hypothetical protein